MESTNGQGATSATLTPPPGLTLEQVPVETKTVTVNDGEKYVSIAGQTLAPLITEAEQLMVRLATIDDATVVQDMERVEYIGSKLKGRINDLEDKVEEKFCKPARTLWQNANDLKKAALSKPQAILDKLRKTHATVRTELDRRKKEAEEKRLAEIRRQDELRKAAEQEHKDHLAAIEENYQFDKRKHDAEVKRIEDERRKKEEDARLNQAQAAENEGAPKERVEAILATPTPLTPVELPKAPEKPTVTVSAPFMPPPALTVAPPPVSVPTLETSGKAINRAPWKARVKNKRMLLQAILDDEASIECIAFNDSYLNEQARKYKDKLAIPGCESYQEAETAFKAS